MGKGRAKGRPANYRALCRALKMASVGDGSAAGRVRLYVLFSNVCTSSLAAGRLVVCPAVAWLTTFWPTLSAHSAGLPHREVCSRSQSRLRFHLSPFGLCKRSASSAKTTTLPSVARRVFKRTGRHVCRTRKSPGQRNKVRLLYSRAPALPETKERADPSKCFGVRPLTAASVGLCATPYSGPGSCERAGAEGYPCYQYCPQ